MAGLNKVVLIGRLGRDPEMRHSQQGLAVVNFPIATNEQWTDKNTGERRDKTEWHNIVAFGRQAEVCEQYLSKGSQIFIEGRLQTSTFEKEGQTHYATKVVVSNFQFLGGKQDSRSPNLIEKNQNQRPTNNIPWQPSSSNSSKDNTTPWDLSIEFDDDKIPF